MKKFSILFAALFIFQFLSKAQSKWEAGGFIAPSISKIDEQRFSKYYDPIFPINYGIRINYNYKKFVFSSGIVHLTQGHKWDACVYTDTSRVLENPPQCSFTTQKIITQGIFIPINVNYNFLNIKKIKLGAGIGVFVGYLYSQKFYYFENKDIRPINFFDNFAFEGNISLSFKYNFNENFCLTLTPTFLYQIRKNLHKTEDSNYGYTPKLWSGMIEIGFYYKFGKNQEENEE